VKSIDVLKDTYRHCSYLVSVKRRRISRKGLISKIAIGSFETVIAGPFNVRSLQEHAKDRRAAIA
jgi:hypothetical protein